MKLFQKFIAFTMMTIILISAAFPASAASIPEGVIPDEAFCFKSTDDEGLNTTGLPKQTRQSSGLITSYRDFGASLAGFRYNIYADGDRLDEFVFVEYLTPSWAPSEGYVWSKSTSVSWSYSGDAVFCERIQLTLGLSKTRTTTYSVAVQIPADSSRWSKLALYSDFFLQKYYVDRDVYNLEGQIVSTHKRIDSGSTYTPAEESYLYVCYK